MAHELPTLESPHKWVRTRAFHYQRTATHKHQGIDLPAKEGTPVLAIAPGAVEHAHDVFTDGFGGYGKVVVVRHDDGTRALYAHLARVNVSEGDRVYGQQKIGEVGRTRYDAKNPDRLFDKDGAHLHFEISPTKYPKLPEATRLDPVAYLRQGRFHPITGQRLGAAAPSETPPAPAAEQDPQSGRPFVAPPARGALLRLSGVCPHCQQSFFCAAVVALEKGTSQ